MPDTETVERVLDAYRDRHRFDTEYRKATGMPAPQEDMPDPVETVQYLRDAVPDEYMERSGDVLEAMRDFYDYESREAVADAAFDVAEGENPDADRFESGSRGQYCPGCLADIDEELAAGSDPEEIDIDPRLRRKYREDEEFVEYSRDGHVRKRGWLLYKCNDHPERRIHTTEAWLEEPQDGERPSGTGQNDSPSV